MYDGAASMEQVVENLTDLETMPLMRPELDHASKIGGFINGG